jgi:hypothetical protein
MRNKISGVAGKTAPSIEGKANNRRKNTSRKSTEEFIFENIYFL